MGLYKRDIFCYNPSRSTHLALWCSRLARQPVTLEVDGSSPFGVAIKIKHHPSGGVFFLCKRRTDSKNKMQHASGVLLAAGLDGGNTIIRVHSGTRMQTSPFGAKDFKFQFSVLLDNAQ